MESVSAMVGSVLPLQRTTMVEMGMAVAPMGEPAATLAAAPAAAMPSEVDADQLNALLQQHQQHLAFSVDEASGHSVIKVIDTTSGDVIRQMPSASWLKLAQELARQAGGLLRTQA